MDIKKLLSFDKSFSYYLKTNISSSTCLAQNYESSL